MDRRETELISESGNEVVVVHGRFTGAIACGPERVEGSRRTP